MDIRWQDKVTNLQLLDKANAVSIEALLIKAQLRWTGHVIRMDASRMPRQILYGELMRGTKEKRSPKEAVQRLHKGDFETVQPTPSRPGVKCSG